MSATLPLNHSIACLAAPNNLFCRPVPLHFTSTTSDTNLIATMNKPGKLIKTPPGSVTNLPPTPPPTDPKPSSGVTRILEAFRALKKGTYSVREPWLAFRLDASEYKDLEQLVQDDGFVQDKVR